jgi:predicted nucleic acid-binding Zn ribbon protein
MSDTPLSTCVHPEGCKHKRAKAKVKRLLGTGAGIIFKGSGFYETDYRSSDYKEAAKKESGPAKTETKEKKESTSGNGKEKSETKKPATKKAEAKAD